MNPKDLKLLDASRRLRYIPRLATNPLVRQMNVAEHSFGVSVLAYLLLKEQMENTKSLAEDSAACILAWCKRFNTLVDAITHDIPEGVTGDILYSTKRDNANIAKEFAKIESRISESMFDSVVHSTSDDQIVKAADMTELLINLDEELQMGNGFPNIQAVWFFSLVMIWRFQVRMNSEVLRTIVDRYMARLPGGSLYITAAAIVLNESSVSSFRVIHGEVGEVYTGFKGVIGQVSPHTAQVLKTVDADKRISWCILVESLRHHGRYFACRVNTNFEESVILYHVSGERDEALESTALDVVLPSHGQ